MSLGMAQAGTGAAAKKTTKASQEARDSVATECDRWPPLRLERHSTTVKRVHPARQFGSLPDPIRLVEPIRSKPASPDFGLAASLFVHVLDKLGKRQTQCCEILDLCPTIRPVHSAPKWRRAAAKATCVGRYLLAAAVRFRQALLASDAPPTDSRDLHIQVLDR